MNLYPDEITKLAELKDKTDELNQQDRDWLKDTIEVAIDVAEECHKFDKNEELIVQLTTLKNARDIFFNEIEPGNKESIKNALTTIIAALENLSKLSMQNQIWFISRMEAMGYEVKDYSGHCFGMSHMSMQAFFCEEMDAFNDRLREIERIPVDGFKNDINYLIKYEQKFREEEDQQSADKIHDLKVGITALFDGISVYQNTRDHSNLFDTPVRAQDAEKTLQLTLPVKLNTNKPVCIRCFSGAYNQDELSQYLTMLQTNLGSNSFALQLNSNSHQINLNYDHKKKHWLLIDPNYLPGIAYEHNEIDFLAKNLLENYTEENGLVMETSLYCLNNDKEKMNNDFTGMQETTEWKRLHGSSKLDIVYQDKKSQLMYAIWRNDLNWIQENCLPGIDFNQTTSEGLNPLMIACILKNEKVVNLLINKTNVNINQKSPEGYTPIMLATIKNHSNIVQQLIEKNADLNQTNDEGETALTIAIKLGNESTVKILSSAMQTQDSLLMSAKTEAITTKKPTLIERFKIFTKLDQSSPQNTPFKKT